MYNNTSKQEHTNVSNKHFTIVSSKNMKPNNSNINSQVSIKITFVTKGCVLGWRTFFFTAIFTSGKVGGRGESDISPNVSPFCALLNH